MFTQSVANIEPGKEIDVNIKYFHTLDYVDGWYEFVFPMVVGPRFNPPGLTNGIGAVARGQSGVSGQSTEVHYLRPGERSRARYLVEGRGGGWRGHRGIPMPDAPGQLRSPFHGSVDSRTAARGQPAEQGLRAALPRRRPADQVEPADPPRRAGRLLHPDAVSAGGVGCAATAAAGVGLRARLFGQHVGPPDRAGQGGGPPRACACFSRAIRSSSSPSPSTPRAWAARRSKPRPRTSSAGCSI